MRLLLVTEDFPPMLGGIAVFLSHLAQTPQMEVTVLAPAMPGDAAADRTLGTRVRRLALPPRRGLWVLFWAILQEARRSRADMVLWGHLEPAAVAGLLACRLLRLPFGVMVHGTDLALLPGQRWPLRDISLATLRRSDLLIANSRYMAQRAWSQGAQPQRTAVVSPGVDVEAFHPEACDADLARHLGLMGRRVILTVGRLVSVKNHQAVLQALPEIAQAVPSTAYLIVGSGPLESTLRDEARRLGLAEHVVFHPAVPPANLPAYYNLADLFVLPSMEGFGIAAIEASACGVPVVGLRAGGLLDAVQDGVTGVLVDPGELASLSRVLIDLLEDRERARQLGCAGRQWAEEKFPWGRAQEAFRTAAESVVGSRSKS